VNRKAIYPGTFDPITLGHLNIVEKASHLFDMVYLAVADFTGKAMMFELDERKHLCQQVTSHLPNVEVMTFHGLVVDFARSLNCCIMIRGMRAMSDFEYELSLALTNKKLEPSIETMFMVPNLQFMYMSSSMIKQLAMLGGNLDEYVPFPVAQALQAKLRDHGKN